MSQEIINKKNIDAIVENMNNYNKKTVSLQEEMVNLKRLVTELTVEVQQLRTQVNISKVIGATGGR